MKTITKPKANHLYILGVTWFICSLAISNMNDVVTKYLGVRLNPMEIAFFRFLFGTLTLLPFMIYYGRKSFYTSRIGIHLIRGMLLFLGVGLWSYGVSTVPLTTATIMSFTVPMFVLIMAPIFLGEQVKLRLWIATIIGFVGAVIVLEPNGKSFNPFAVVLLISAMMFAILDIINKKYVIQETMLSMLFYSALVTTILSIPFTLPIWITPSYEELYILLLLGAGSNIILYYIVC